MKTITEEILLQNMTNLEKLKANIHVNAMQNYIDYLRKKWNPKTTIVEGSKTEGVLYWNEYDSVWTIEESAFRGFIFKNIIRIMDNSKIIGNHKKKYNEPTILTKSVQMENTIAGSKNTEGEV